MGSIRYMVPPPRPTARIVPTVDGRIDSDDMLVGEVEVARGTRIAWIGDGVVWIIERDSVDVPWLVRYRLTGGEG